MVRMYSKSITVTTLVILIGIQCFLLDHCEGSITSSRYLEKLEGGLQWVDVGPDAGSIYEQLMSVRHKSRFRRDTANGKLPDVSKFDLKNDTTHNQALIHWSGENSKVVFILTRKKSGSGTNKVTESTLWRSTDYGTTYQPMGKKFGKDTVLKSYFVCPIDKKKIIFVDAVNDSRKIWTSNDEGESYTAVDVPFRVEKLEFHPENSMWILGYDKLFKTLWCTKDFGKTWHKLSNEVTNERYYWYVKGVDTGDRAKEIVHFEYRNLKFLPRRLYLMKSCYIPNCEKAPFQKQIDDLQFVDMDSLVVQDSYAFVQKSGAANKLYVSYKRGPFVKANFPLYPGEAQSHFHVVSSDTECVVLGVNHANGLTHLFFSNLRGDSFTQSLSNVRYYNRKVSDNKVYTVDIHEVQGIIGTFLANVHQSDGLGYNITKITWDNGRTWADIKNATFCNSEKVHGCDDCQLNLHLSMDQTKSGYYMPSVVSKKSVPGLIIAHGTYGSTVEDNPNQVLMFVSNDNGKTWRCARQQRHLVVVADHGAVIVAIQMIFLQPVKKLYYSHDYGRTWVSATFANDTVNVDGILTEPGENTHYLTLFGHRTYADSWRIFKIDMASTFDRTCVYPDDFRNVTLPTQVKDNTCHLGLVQMTERLKTGTDCLINSTYRRIYTKKICSCTDKDYECDLGYQTKAGDEKTCEKVSLRIFDEIGTDSFFAFPEREKKCTDGMRNVTTGFRKIPGDKCVNEVPGKLWRVEPCSGEAPTTAAPLPNLEITLVNSTASARMGENLLFSVKGGNSDVVWHIINPSPPPAQIRSKTNLSLAPKFPGTYKVQVSSSGSKFSNMILVEFWYPIKKVFLYHPPVVAKNKPCNATVYTETSHGIRGNRTLLGDVQYIWNMEKEQVYSDDNQMIVNVSRFRNATSVKIDVTAENTVSQQTKSGQFHVKEFLETLVLEFDTYPLITKGNMSDVWIEEFQDELRLVLFQMEELSKIRKDKNLVHGMNFFVYVPPAESLRAYIYLAPLSRKVLRDDLLQVVLQVEKTIAEGDIKILLAHDVTAKVKSQYVIDHDGTMLWFSAQTGPRAGLIALGVIISILLCVIAFFVVRWLAKRSRFDRYLHFRNLRGTSGGAPRIVRSQDRSPIVADEFIDDDLDTMEGIGSQDATLQFQG